MKVAVIGAGIVGLACAEELVRAGHDVRLFDPDPGSGATRAAAGMLAPAGEAWHGETELLRLGVASARLWPQYAARLHAASGLDVDLRTAGTLLVGQDHDDLQQVRRTLEVLEAEGLAFRELDRREARAEEPTLSRIAGAALLPDDHHVNPRRVAAAPAAPGVRAPGPGPGDGHVDGCGHGRRSEFCLRRGGRRDGAEARSLVPQVRPVRGETIRLRVIDPPSRVLRAGAR